MFRIFLLSCLIQLESCFGSPISNEVINDRELVLAFAVNRHGERSPDSDELSLSNEDTQNKIKNLTHIEGPEGLTNTGKRRAYQIGQFYRERYGPQGHKLISNLYLGNEISIRSTDKERTKMTIQVAMAAVYPPVKEQQWDEHLGKVWQPVPYRAVPLSEDYLRYYSNCERFISLMSIAKQQSIQKEFLPYKDLMPFLKEKTGQDFTANPIMFQSLFDLFRSMVGLGLDIPEWATPLMPKLGEAARTAYQLYFRNNEMKKIGGGVILSDFIQAANDIVSGKPVSQRLRLFSAHDFNIGALMEVTKVKSDHSIPEYGAVFALELYRSKKTGEYSVLPVYLPQAGDSTAQQLHFTGCENNSFCEYNKFRQFTKEFVLPEHEYYKMCNIKTEL